MSVCVDVFVCVVHHVVVCVWCVCEGEGYSSAVERMTGDLKGCRFKCPSMCVFG